MIDHIEPKIKGRIRINVGHRIEYFPNAIGSDMNWILANLLKGDLNYQVTSIEVYRAGILLDVAYVNNSSEATIGPIEVKFTGLYDLPVFSGIFDEVRLKTTNGTLVSSVTGLNVNRVANEVISIIWILTFI